MALTYIGTRDAKIRAAASEAILRGICPDGGLYIPEALEADMSAAAPIR